MAKINVTKPTGEIEAFNLVSAFKADNQIYVIIDSERMGSMGLPIIYVSKFTNKLEKISDANEWQSVKNYLKGIINGTNFEYVKMASNISADEAYYTPLTLPQASFDIIKSRYVVTDSSEEEQTLEKNDSVSVSDLINEIAPVNEDAKTTVAPVIPQNVANSNMEIHSTEINRTPVIEQTIEQPIATTNIEPTSVISNPISSSVSSNVEPSFTSAPASSELKTTTFDVEKETFLKACENMFDALINKYERKLAFLETKEQELAKKEQEIDRKLKNANEHLANAEAREKVANIAHDNAQRVMDISSLMPNNSNNN